VNLLWSFASVVLTGLAFPVHFLPGWAAATVWVGTPFPSMLQAPLDIAVERGSPASQVAVIAGQVAWAVVLLVVCVLVQRRAEHKLVVQGG